VQRQQQLDRTQQTFDAATSVAQSIMAQAEAGAFFYRQLA
jgi:predicted transcriptional regulator